MVYLKKKESHTEINKKFKIFDFIEFSGGKEIRKEIFLSSPCQPLVH